MAWEENSSRRAKGLREPEDEAGGSDMLLLAGVAAAVDVGGVDVVKFPVEGVVVVPRSPIPVPVPVPVALLSPWFSLKRSGCKGCV